MASNGRTAISRLRELAARCFGGPTMSMEVRVAARNLPTVYRRRRTGRRLEPDQRLSIAFEDAGRCVELRGAMVQVGDELEGVPTLAVHQHRRREHQQWSVRHVPLFTFWSQAAAVNSQRHLWHSFHPLPFYACRLNLHSAAASLLSAPASAHDEARKKPPSCLQKTPLAVL